jgi:tRNA(Ile)-lysidine synthase
VTAATADRSHDGTGDDGRLLLAARDALAHLPLPPRVIGLAVSGGSDSMAMLHLMARAAPEAGWGVEAATVDHGLRAGSAAEAALVARTCAALGIPHATLRWRDHPAGGNLMDAARRARYRLLADWARSRRIGDVAVAHTADDQAETLLIGLSRAAGLDGLAGMRPRWEEAGVRFHRPFLHQARAALRAYLQRRGLPWCDDPTNDNDRFARTRARRALAALAPLGISAETLAQSADHLAAALAVVKQATEDAFARTGHAVAGMIELDHDAYGDLHPEVARRMLVAALRWLSGAGYPPRGEALARADSAIRQGRDATLHGCRIRLRKRRVHLVREPRAAGPSVPPGQPWDNRWHVTGPFPEDAEIRALGARGLRLCADWRATGLPRDALIVTPAVWRGDALVAAPIARPDPAWSAEVRPDFAAWIAH